jgi:hypothetical protein
MALRSTIKNHARINQNLMTITRQMHSDSKKYRSFLALLFAAGDLRRYKHLTNKSKYTTIVSTKIPKDYCETSDKY